MLHVIISYILTYRFHFLHLFFLSHDASDNFVRVSQSDDDVSGEVYARVVSGESIYYFYVICVSVGVVNCPSVFSMFMCAVVV